MKNPIIFLAIILVVFLAVFAVVNLGNKTNDQNNLNWTNDINLALKEAQATNKTVMIDFYSLACDNCAKLDDVTFKDPTVEQKLTSNYVLVKIDIDKNPDLANNYQIISAPVLVFLNANGTEIKRIEGYKEPEEFIKNLS